MNITQNGNGNTGFVNNGGQVIGTQDNRVFNYNYSYSYSWPLFVRPLLVLRGR